LLLNWLSTSTPNHRLSLEICINEITNGEFSFAMLYPTGAEMKVSVEMAWGLNPKTIMDHSTQVAQN
jgi:hypothetical protein